MLKKLTTGVVKNNQSNSEQSDGTRSTATKSLSPDKTPVTSMQHNLWMQNQEYERRKGEHIERLSKLESKNKASLKAEMMKAQVMQQNSGLSKT